MTASSPAASDEELGRSAKKAKTAAEIEKDPEVNTQMDLETQTEMREDEPDTKKLKVQAVTEGLWNDITPEMLESGRNKELRQLDDFEVFTSIDEKDCAGEKVLGATWFDRRNGDDYRSRHCVQDFARVKSDDNFAPTPTDETTRILEAFAVQKKYKMRTADVS